MFSLIVVLRFTLTLFAQLVLPVHTFHNSNSSDQDALLAFRNSPSLDPYNFLHEWSPNHYFGNWTGVGCSSRRPRVISLNLTGMGLVGPISPILADLSFLRLLDLFNNSFQGQIPPQLGKLFRLRILRLSLNQLEGSIPSTLGDCPLEKLGLSYNKLEGSIPSSLGGCHSLQILILSSNNLSGNIPSELGHLQNLEILWLDSNQLTGIVPPFVRNMSSLTQLTVGNNRLHGSIPVELGSLTRLQVLTLRFNSLTGPIPTALSNCTNLQILQLSGNQLVGRVPWEFGRLSDLQNLYLWNNQLNGEIPSSLSNCTRLKILDLDSNHFSGTVPLEFGKLLQLQKLVLWGNHLVSGSSSLPIITALTNCSSLEYIDFSLNNLTGIVPSTVGLLSTSLYYLGLALNELEGNLPDEIGNLTKLAELQLRGNHFSGIIPSTLTMLPNLERLYLNNNNLQGSIPTTFGLAKRLGLLALSENMLSGKIPDSLGDIPQLRVLVLRHNQLSGRIPASLGRCETLELVDLAYNKLTGNIPPEVAALSNLQFYFNVSNNLLEGSILEMSKMVMVKAIDLSLNRMSGSIPSALESCTALEYLNLSWNSFEGSIPASLANLQNLQTMDLSYNNLSGKIPTAFGGMKMLQFINLSFNRLTGEVPKGGVFGTLETSEIMGNLGLCGSWINLPPCSKHKQLSTSKKVIIPVGIAITILIMSFALLALSSKWRRTRSPRTSQDSSALKMGNPRISYGELVDSTGGFAEANLLGTGAFGSVYKGILKNGTNIAVKVLNLLDANAHKSFQRECNVLKQVRHRNVIKIISVCSNLDFKALVLPLMSNGSLEKWLYAQEDNECKLNLHDRLRIIMETAEGLAYLHHHCIVQVIHGDLKPSNVLLGDNMTTYIADFGIAKILFSNSLDHLTSTNALKGSIGYIAPEYGMGQRMSTKGDVYSFGILLLELLIRRRPIDDMFIEEINLQKWVSMHFPNKIMEVVDNCILTISHELETSMLLACLTQLLHVGLDCTNESPQQRPDMTEIIKRLHNIKDIPGEPCSLAVDVAHWKEVYHATAEGWQVDCSVAVKLY